MDSAEQSLIVQHPAGPIELYFAEEKLLRLQLLPIECQAPLRAQKPPVFLRKLIADVKAGVDLAWAFALCDLSALTAFRCRVLTCLCEAVPAGQLISYADLALCSGSPRAMRAIGGAMAHNPYPLIIPCHRVITADGRIGGFMGKAHDPSGWKQRLLEREGFTVTAGRVH